jgi:N6-L-threonylcarbamoyladenine synthase
MIILGLETSCDETGCAVVADGRRVLANLLDSQEQIHAPYGGVVPELACRRHVAVIDQLVARALAAAGLRLQDLDAVAVTQGPGLIGALAIGVGFGKALAYRLRRRLIGVNHLEGHLAAIELEDGAPLALPAVGLVVSGGHTSLYEISAPGKITALGGTVDDAAGEAFDKGAKLLGLGYPGGPMIDRLARGGDPARFRFPRPRAAEPYDFSFSGLKTALRYALERSAFGPDALERLRPDLAAGYQEAIVDALVDRTLAAAEAVGARGLVICGGVAANSRLRERFGAACAEHGLALRIPAPRLCTDNGAMIAAAAWWHRDAQHDSDWGLVPRPHWPL